MAMDAHVFFVCLLVCFCFCWQYIFCLMMIIRSWWWWWWWWWWDDDGDEMMMAMRRRRRRWSWCWCARSLFSLSFDHFFCQWVWYNIAWHWVCLISTTRAFWPRKTWSNTFYRNSQSWLNFKVCASGGGGGGGSGGRGGSAVGKNWRVLLKWSGLDFFLYSRHTLKHGHSLWNPKR